QIARDAGAAEIHMRIAAPPTAHPCYYGIDTPSREELMASRLDVEAIAEQIVLDNCASAVIVRTSLIYGICPLDHQTKWLVDDVTSGKNVVLFTDEVRCPIWVDTLAHSLLELANDPFHGFLNIAGPNPLNRWDFGIKLLDMLNVDLKSNIIPGLQSESGLLRPRNLTLEVDKAQHLLDTPLLNVDQAIHHMRSGLSAKTIID
ncbi:MAG: sugar nucleotide-binding protein, partial [Dehalococcoidia bacterium]|nr:sugar nucleotide-binding protein [Dehalococcoidia bacterium]